MHIQIKTSGPTTAAPHQQLETILSLGEFTVKAGKTKKRYAQRSRVIYSESTQGDTVQVLNSSGAISILPPRSLFNQDAGLMSYLKKKSSQITILKN